MEFDKGYTKHYWGLMSGVLLATPTCKDKKVSCRKCKYKQLCEFTIKITNCLSEA